MKKNSKSQALVLVLIIVTIFAAIVVTIGALTAHELEMREVDEMALNANYAAESGYERGRYVLKGSALRFDGVDDYVHIKDGSLIAREYNSTIEAWVKLNNDLTAEKAVYDESTATGTVFRLRIRSDEKPGFSLQIGSTFYEATSLEAILPNQWYHLIGVLSDSGGMKIYVNGSEKGANTNTSRCSYVPTASWIGRYRQSGYYFPGIIDEVRIYNRAISSQEVLEHYNGIYKDESGLVLLQHFEEGPSCQSGACLTDDSTYTNNGTPYGFDGLSEYDKTGATGGWTRSYPNPRGVVISHNNPTSCPDSKVSSVLCNNDKNPLDNGYSYSVTITPKNQTKPDGQVCGFLFCITYSGQSP